ncbi:MAG TPA: glucosamine-6-phosphate deaminase [Nitrospiraceae bacterium]|nr:glucosamine-6-phosphate deaminase [Nitrospiraceae bacterium]
MVIVIKDSYAELSRSAAHIIAHAIEKNPRLTLGLATGKTPMGLYQELIRLHREEGLNFSDVVTFNLDEYLGLSPDHPQSYHAFMHRHFFDHVNIEADHIHIPRGSITTDYGAYCASYEERIRRAGGIDLQILGIGINGHIGFNEATSSLSSRTRLVALTSQTIEENRRFFPADEDMPSCAITMGLGTILEARRIVLLASGRKKANAVAQAIEGPVTASITASVLQLHADVIVIIDRDAAEELTRTEYYDRVVKMTARYMPERLW